MRKLMRFPDFDYSTRGAYFITQVTQDRKNLFGYIKDDEMILNEAGKMIKEEYNELEKRYTRLGCMDVVVMPNHIHCLLYIDKDSKDTIPEIMRPFKSKTTVRYIQGVKEHGWTRFDYHLWQRNYWDDIIWNERQYEFAQRYIALNPSRWSHDNINDEHDKDTDHILQRLRDLR